MELRNSMSISSNIHMYKSSRESNIELLRLLAGMGVIVLHFNYFPGGGGALETASGVNFYVLLVLEILCVSAVNIFILISGYYGCESKKNENWKVDYAFTADNLSSICDDIMRMFAST